MKGIYIVFGSKSVFEKKYKGVIKKINSQLKVFNMEKINTQLYFVEPDNRLIYKVARRLPFDLFINTLQLELDEHCDFLYIRKPLLNYHFINYLKKVKSKIPKCKILLEIPTYPYDYEFKKSFLNAPLYYKDRYYRKSLSKYVDRIVTYSLDEEIFGIPTIKISNGVDTKLIKKKKLIISNEINIIAVATFEVWHGYDRFIEGMGRYYKNKGDREIKLHIVGNGDVISDYKRIAENYNISDKVIFHGYKTGEDLDNVYDKCQIALDAMGRHRSGVYYNSSLKSKEYAAKGLPIISGVETELDKVDDFDYYLRVPANEEPIDMNEVIQFYNKIYKDKDPNSIISDIRRYAEENFDITKCMRPVIDFIKYEKD